MNKRTSVIQEPLISNYFYAVYPLSIEFKQPCQNLLYLQFEKNLQIMLKFQLNKGPAVKGQTVNFQSPQKVNHFRILSDKNLQYQWSLYSNQLIDQQNREQFIESQKINYKNYWNDFTKKSQDKHIINVQFKKIKCKLEYIFVIATNSNQLVAKIRNHYYMNRRSIVREQNNQEKEKVIQNQQENLEGKTPQPPADVQQQMNNQGIVQSQPEPLITIQSINLKLSSMHESVNMDRPSNKESNREEFLTPQKKELQLGTLEARLQKLSHSEIELSNQISMDVQDVQSSMEKVTPKNRKQEENGNFFIIKQATEQEIIDTALVPPSNDYLTASAKKQQAEITLTNSTLLNQKKQPIMPYYKNNKYIIIVAIILLIVLSCLSMYFMSKSKEVNVKIDKVPKSSQKQIKKKQKGTKKSQKPQRK